MVESDNLIGLVPERLVELKKSKIELSYSKMCKCLGIEQKGGTAKKKQLEQLKDYCCYEVLKKPTRYVVTSCGPTEEIRAKREKGFSPNRRGNLFPVIEEMLFKMLEKNTTLYFTKKELLFKLGLVGKNFKYITNDKNRKLLVSKIDCTKDELEIFSGNVFYRVLWPLVNRILLKLQDEGKIILNTGFMYKDRNVQKFFTVLPDSELGKEMIAVEARVLKQMKKTKSKLATPYLRAKYREECNKEIRKTHKNIEFFFESIGIFTSEEVVKNSLDELRSQVNKLSMKKCLSTTTLDDLTGKTRKYLIKETISFQASEDYEMILSEFFT